MPFSRTLPLLFMLTVPALAGLPTPTTAHFLFGETQLVMDTSTTAGQAHPEANHKDDDDRGSSGRSGSGHIAKVIITDGALTDDDQPPPKDPKKVKKTLHAHADLLGLASEHLAEMVLVAMKFDQENNCIHYFFQQRYRGLSLLNGRMHVKVDRARGQIEITNGFYAFQADTLPSPKRIISAQQAVDEAASAAGLIGDPEYQLPAARHRRTFDRVLAPTWVDDPLPVRRALQVDADNNLLLVWDIQAHRRETGQTLHAVVDAVAGWVLESAIVGNGDFREHFEDEGQGWTASGLWHLTETGDGACRPADHDGSLAAYFGDSATCSYATGRRVRGSLTSPVFRVQTHTATLRFKYRLEVEPYAFRHDLNAVTVVIGDRVFALTQLDPETDATGAWRETPAISLAAFAGQDIQLRFTFDSIDGLNNDYAGWMIDEVVVENNDGVVENNDGVVENNDGVVENNNQN